MSRAPGTQIYVRIADKERLERIAAEEVRPVSDQLTVILNTYERLRSEQVSNPGDHPAPARSAASTQFQ